MVAETSALRASTRVTGEAHAPWRTAVWMRACTLEATRPAAMPLPETSPRTSITHDAVGHQHVVEIAADPARRQRGGAEIVAADVRQLARQQVVLHVGGVGEIALEVRLPRQPLADAFEGRGEPLPGHRLEQVIDRVVLEGLDGEGVVGRGEDDERPRLGQ